MIPVTFHEKKRSWKAEVIADNSGQFVGNSLRFATKEEAQGYVENLASRWTLVTVTRVVASDDPVNDKFPREAGEARG